MWKWRREKNRKRTEAEHKERETERKTDVSRKGREGNPSETKTQQTAQFALTSAWAPLSSQVLVSLKDPSCPRRQGQARQKLWLHLGPLELSQMGLGDQARFILLVPGLAWLQAATRLGCVDTCPSASWRMEGQHHQADTAQLGGSFSEAQLVGQHPTR